MKGLWAGTIAVLLTATSNFAQTWMQQRSGTTEILTDVHFVDAETGYVTGTFGTILKTTDGGQQWTKLPSPSNESFTAVAARNAEHVFVGRNGLFASVDEGNRWEEIGEFSGISSSIFDIDFVGVNAGYLVKGGIIYKTEDGGETWEEVYREEDQIFLDRLHVPEGEVVYATGGFTRSEIFGFVSQGFVVRSLDEGETWRLLDTDGISDIMAASWIDGLQGFLFTFTGPVHRTFNGGETWEEISTNFEQLGSPLIVAAQIIDAQVGYATSFDGRIFRTEDGALTWCEELNTASEETPGVPLTAIHVLGGELAYVVGNDGLIFKREAAFTPQPLQITGIRLNRAKNLVDITFNAETGKPYRLATSPNLQTPWAESETFIPTALPWTVTAPIDDLLEQYFRLVQASTID